MDADKCLEKLSTNPFWHVRLFFVLMFAYLFPGAFHMLSIVWLAYKPKHHCKLPANSTISDWLPKNDEDEFSSCLIYSNKSLNLTKPCPNGWNYDLDTIGPTLVTEWDLVCDKSYWAQGLQTSLTVGVMFGSLFFTSLSDHLGRKSVIVLSSIGLMLTNYILVVTRNFYFFLFIRFFVGMFQQGIILCGAVLICESFPAKYRAFAGIIPSGIWGFAVSLLPWIALLSHNWVYFQLIITSYSLIALPLLYFIPESIMWLQANNRVEEADKIVINAAKTNKIIFSLPILKRNFEDEFEEEPTPTSPQSQPEISFPIKEKNNYLKKRNSLNFNIFKLKNNKKYQKQKSPSSLGSVKYSSLQLVQNKVLCRNLFISIFIWIVVNLIYYGLALTSTMLAGNIFLNSFLASIIEFPACVVIFLAVERFGRKHPTIFGFFLGGVPLIVYVLIKIFFPRFATHGILVMLNLVGKFGITASFSVMFFYVAELFPTNLRNQALGICAFCGRFGSLFASFAGYFIENHPYITNIIFGILSLLAGISIFFLPETHRKPMPETIEEISAWYNESEKENNSNEDQNEKVDVLVSEEQIDNNIISISENDKEVIDDNMKRNNNKLSLEQNDNNDEILKNINDINNNKNIPNLANSSGYENGDKDDLEKSDISNNKNKNNNNNIDVLNKNNNNNIDILNEKDFNSLRKNLFEV